jgi:hypothetical protein
VSCVFENLATHLFETRIVFLKVPPERIVWIERLAADESAEPGTVRETCCQVVLEWDGRRYHSPKRIPVLPDTVKDMLEPGG